jgi:hypothetical protein
MAFWVTPGAFRAGDLKNFGVAIHLGLKLRRPEFLVFADVVQEELDTLLVRGVHFVGSALEIGFEGWLVTGWSGRGLGGVSRLATLDTNPQSDSGSPGELDEIAAVQVAFQHCILSTDRYAAKNRRAMRLSIAIDMNKVNVDWRYGVSAILH